jgi:CBS domain containing-hemolysin-like protein
MITLATIQNVPIPSDGVVIVLIIGFLVMSFLFSGTETAFFSLQSIETQRLEDDGARGARVLSLLDKRSDLITTILLGNETANIALTSFVAVVLAQKYGLPSWSNVILVTPVLVLFTEITPKVLAFRVSQRWATRAAPVLIALMTILYPIRYVIGSVVRLLSSLFGVTQNKEASGIDEREFLTLLDHGEESGAVDATERERIEAVFDLDDTPVGKVMTPLPDVQMVSIDTDWAGLARFVSTHDFSRIPVHGETKDDILGVLLVKDLLKYKNKPFSTLSSIKRTLFQPAYVPLTKPTNEMLQGFIEQKQHLAFVVDEHGTLMGLVTMDDLLAEFMGENDAIESDETESTHRLDLNRVIVDGRMEESELLEHTAFQLPQGAYHTVGGFLLHQFGRLPSSGDKIEYQGYRFTIRSVVARRIVEVEIESLVGQVAAPNKEA